jgi:DNA (cytosine-5)-methyltransferase 1
MGAADVGANHQRDRIWIVGKMAHSNSNGFNNSEQRELEKSSIQAAPRKKFDQIGGHSILAFSQSKGSQGWNNEGYSEQRQSRLREGGWSVQGNWSIEPNVGRVANGVAARVDRLKAIGNGQVPLCAATAWRLLST